MSYTNVAGATHNFHVWDDGSGNLTATADIAVAGTPVSATAPFPVMDVSPFATVSVDITRPANTTAYAAEDALSDSTTSPASGGFTITGAARVSGGSGVIRDAVFVMSTNASASLSGEIWVFDSAVTNINDNAAFAISDAEAKTLVGIIPFSTGKSGSNNAAVYVSGIDMHFTTIGSANLRFLVKVTNAYTPASAEVLTSRFKIQQF